MSYRIGAAIVVFVIGFGGPAIAKTLPAVQLTPSNQPAQCTTPGRLMAFIRARNPRLREKFAGVAADYHRHGRDLGVRWDYAFFQMVVETNSLKYTGDVRPQQNNFAGLGATGGGVKGEAFATVSDGVRAHLQHLMLYAGVRVEDPVADRTRKVQSWGILDKWRSSFRRPITYGDVGAKWAPSDRGYADDIQAIAEAFYASSCKESDPSPDAVADAGDQSPSADSARYNSDARAALGASNIKRDEGAPPASYRTLNAEPDSNASAPAANQQTKTAAKFASPGIQPPAATSQTKCRVWTASYGGQNATIIRSSADGIINYTVLDVNKGREEAETKAYIAAYAKGGARMGDYPSKSAAMDKAFKLCPKG